MKCPPTHALIVIIKSKILLFFFFNSAKTLNFSETRSWLVIFNYNKRSIMENIDIDILKENFIEKSKIFLQN